MNIVTWFDRRPLSPLSPDPAVIVGGTTLVNEFIAQVEQSGQHGQLAVAVPFINRNLVNELSTWQGIIHQRITCSLVTSTCLTSEEACRTLVRLPWSSLEIFESHTLHAKTYAFIGQNGFAAALIGSHNLTFAGTSRNIEAGVLLLSRARTQLSITIEDCIEHIKHIGHSGKKLYDSTSWPEGILQ